ncbi:hypothetical protein [Halomarina rubra]|uniref:Uncharacterized protein n=1 Tax=Halomarina rubra TaxID=2071873 RepID=A0ABD6AU00_9EURY|nr:hypothetical protein [Halomarina rubra]
MSGFGEAVAGIGKASAIIGGVFAVAAMLKILGLFMVGMQTASTGVVPAQALAAIIIIATLAQLPWWLT